MNTIFLVLNGMNFGTIFKINLEDITWAFQKNKNAGYITGQEVNVIYVERNYHLPTTAFTV